MTGKKVKWCTDVAADVMWKHKCNKRFEARKRAINSYDLLDNNVEKNEFLYKVYCALKKTQWGEI